MTREFPDDEPARRKQEHPPERFKGEDVGEDTRRVLAERRKMAAAITSRVVAEIPVVKGAFAWFSAADCRLDGKQLGNRQPNHRPCCAVAPTAAEKTRAEPVIQCPA